jgi:predicted dehydrogenase
MKAVCLRELFARIVSKEGPSVPKNNGKIRYAVVGLGGIAQMAVLPAFKHAENSQLTALVSGDPTKQKELSARYRVRNVYSYEQYDNCLSSGEVDAVYLALPNQMHADFTIAAARAGVHVLCEKPMAVTEDECKAMIAAARDADVKLMIAYRLHFEEGNLEAIRIAQSGQIGDLRIFNSIFSQQVHAGNVRLRESAAGGTLEDMGIYCINAARYLFREEPTEVFAFSPRGTDPRFKEVDEMTAALLRFPQDRLATFVCSFGADPVSNYTLVGTKGSLRVEPGYEYQTEVRHYLTVNERTKEQVFPKRDQFAPELIYFSNCIVNDKEPEPSGEEGLADVQVIRGLRKSAELNAPVKLPPIVRMTRPTPSLEIERPPVKKPPKLVHAKTASGES